MKNAMQLKAIVRNMAKEKNISAQLVLQNFMLERLLERISVSRYRANFILKGGFLIAAMVGLDSRATMDMDATIKGMPVNEKEIQRMFEEICAIDLLDDVAFSFQHIGKIRETDEYIGYRVALTAGYPPMAVPLKLDITTGDKITPGEITYAFPLLLEARNISILAYNLETVLAEKLETVVARGEQNTRIRDYYDIFILVRLQGNHIDLGLLKKALFNTSKKRNSLDIIKRYPNILDTVKNSDVMCSRWEDYQRNFSYALGIKFEEICKIIYQVLICIME